MRASLRLKLIVNFFFVVLLTGIVSTIISVYLNSSLSMPQAMIQFSSVIFAGTVLAFLVFVFLSRTILKPLKELASKAQQSVKGENDSQFRFNFDNGLVDIGKALDHMTSYIKECDKEIGEMRKQITEARRLSTLGQLAAGVAHEINNPLGGIVVYSNLLLEDTSPDDPIYSNIKKIVRESNRCRNIVKGLLDFARQSHPALNREDIKRVIVDALDNIRRKPIFDHIRIIEEYDDNLPSVCVDASQIQEVFENIIQNAAEVMNGSGELIITSRIASNKQDRQMIEITFADTGPGIHPDHIERIFEPFFTTKEEGHGTGLGLAVSYGIIERHEGTITVRNRTDGGALFSILLPVKEAD